MYILLKQQKKKLKEAKYLYSSTPKERIVEDLKEYKKRLKTVRRSFESPDEIDDLKISFDEKCLLFEFDPTVGDDYLVIYNNIDSGNKYDILVNIIELLD
jgi:hypothetical protein